MLKTKLCPKCRLPLTPDNTRPLKKRKTGRVFQVHIACPNKEETSTLKTVKSEIETQKKAPVIPFRLSQPIQPESQPKCRAFLDSVTAGRFKRALEKGSPTLSINVLIVHKDAPEMEPEWFGGMTEIILREGE